MSARPASLGSIVSQLQKEKEENESLQVKCKRLKGSLARAENIIVQLRLSGSNGDLNLPRAMVIPGVSRKVLEALTRENNKLKQGLENVTMSKNGAHLAVENKELHEIIIALRDERDQKNKEVEELRELLKTVEDERIKGFRDQVFRLADEVSLKWRQNLNPSKNS